MTLSIVDPADGRVSESKITKSIDKPAKTSESVLRLKSGIDIERHFLTILFADVVNYSRLIEIDDLKTVFHLERLRSDVIRPIAKRHGADIVRNFGGDGLVVSFADPVFAVRCAVELQEQTKAHESSWLDNERVHFRIGIAMGSLLLVNGSLHGGPINVAARLQALAEPDGIWTTEPVIRQMHSGTGITFEALGKLQLRNIAESVEAYRVVHKHKVSRSSIR